MDVERVGSQYGTDVVAALGALWGKSKERAGGRTNLLLSHLLDTAAVAELVFDHYLAPVTRDVLEEVAGPGRGRRFFAWLCGVHDCGKATPAHQRLWPEGAEAVRAVGLTWLEAAAVAGARQKKRWRHDWAGGLLVRRALSKAGWAAEQVDWLWPLVAGHHGAFPTLGDVQEPRAAKGQLRGTGRWCAVHQAVLDVFTRELGIAELGEIEPAAVPSRAVQLQLSGLVVMADWVASDERYFPGVDDLRSVGLETARVRARAAWQQLGLHGGWGALAVPGIGMFENRFKLPPRKSQTMVIEAARRMRTAGLLVVEAPMGEGKTEAALAAAEVLAARFGLDGVFVGMPTQATSDPMFTRTRRWVETIDASLASQVALLHGKRAFNKEWKALLEKAGTETDASYAGVDEYGLDDDPYGIVPACGGAAERLAPAEWFLGSKRGLLAPFAVGTIDQLLHAATRTRHVMLRMAGLAGKVVVLDEVHACDVYMGRFLLEALRWLGQARVPVVLLSATLPPGQRGELVAAYLAGAASREEFAVAVPEVGGYPSVIAAWLDRDTAAPSVHSWDADAWRPDLTVTVETLGEEKPARRASRSERRAVQCAADESVADLLAEQLAEGGTALAIRNTVSRAQSLYEELKERFPADEVRLLHARFTVARRAELTEEALRLLGPDCPRPEGGRLVLVATQLAEQSFDVDADLLVTDLAPIDLLLQRIGRLHRHAGTRRPDRLRQPKVFVTGFRPREGREPDFLYASEKIYGRHLLLRTAAVLPGGGAWAVPGQVPELVKAVYAQEADLLPESWAAAGVKAREEQLAEDRRRAEAADEFLLTRHGEHECSTLAGLHYGGVSSGSSEEELQAAVRDGDESVEVVLAVQAAEGQVYRTLSGRALTVNGDVAPELLDEVIGSTVRLPTSLTKDALQLSPLPGWRGHPWLRHSRALVLDASRHALLGDHSVRYDHDLGLRTELASG
ncbi:CRISPR-associated helicase Cas3' [Streptomyces sp. NPDC002519]